MNKLLSIFAVPASAALLALGGCAQSKNESTGEVARQYLQLWMDEYHPGVTQDANGLYLLSDEPGTGALWDSQKGYTWGSITIRTLGGTIVSTDSERLAQQLGTWAEGNYYGHQLFYTGENYSIAGLDALLGGMRMGGTRTAVIPAWMVTTSRYGTQQEYIDAATSSSHYIYTVTPGDQTEDAIRWEKDSLTTYVKRHFGADIKSLAISSDAEPDSSFYFISNTLAFEGIEKIASGTTVSLNYTGRLLNGQVFDTTDEKTAKDAGIYDASRTYAPVSISLNSEMEDIAMDGSTQLATGFKGGLHHMHWKGQKASALFISSLGYSTSGKGDKIPGYSPLFFELEILSD